MTPRLPTPRQLEQLFQDLEDGALSADDHAWLMDLLRERPEIRAAYHEHMALATGLHELAEAWAPEHEEPARESPEVLQRRSLRRSFLAAAALVALLAVAGSFIAIRGRTLPPVMATAGAGTVWRFEDGGIGRKGDFLPATRIAIDHGTVEVVTRSRTRMLLEGPAIFEIHDPRRVSLSRGKGWFDVAPGDEGFTVLTGRLHVIDLGTRFGISSLGASDRVQVESGSVRLESRFPGIPPAFLKSGQAADVDLVGRTTAADYDPALFLHSLPVKPVAIHWSFDEEGADGFPATATGFKPAPVRVSGFGSATATARVAPGRFGSALDLTAGDSFAESDFPGISGSGPRTVALWVKGSPIERRKTNRSVEYTPSVVSWGDDSIPGGLWSVRAHCISGLVGTQWAGNGWMTAGKIGSQDILDDRWHHIASVYTGAAGADGDMEMVRHYIDGKRVETTHVVMGHDIDTRAGGAAACLRLAYDGRLPSGPGNIPVILDELHIVRAALSDEQIETLFRENRID